RRQRELLSEGQSAIRKPMGIFNDIFPIPFFGTPRYGGRLRRDGTGTADGGRPSAIDRIVDTDTPIEKPLPGAVEMKAAQAERVRNRKLFRVTPETRMGGSGLFQDDED
ncbi:MAG: hypothetical protein KGJ13_13075, partial [Patescibacteria group bacterium]|nr:hypothetical protein [Patescibacteria group bacterium]